MKRIFAVILVTALVLSGCGTLVPAKSTAPTAQEPAPTETQTAAQESGPQSTEPAQTEAPAPAYFNPLNGAPMDEPYTGRIIALPISNVYYALPHYGTNQADILMEMWVNGSIIRDLALYTDPSKVPQIGSIRSVRMMFNQIVTHYDAILFDAGGDSRVLTQSKTLGVDRFNIYADTNAPTYYSVRDMSRDFMFKTSDKYEHCLFAKGEGLLQLAESKGFATTQDADKDYFLRFVDDGTPAGGTDANQVSVTFTYNGNKKSTTMVYNKDLGKYVYNQYDKEMVDGATGEPEAFNNVIVMLAKITTNSIYHLADFSAGGEGYFACGGKVVPIYWLADSDTSPFRFFTMDGEPLNLNRGNTYIAVAPTGSPVECK